MVRGDGVDLAVVEVQVSVAVKEAREPPASRSVHPDGPLCRQTGRNRCDFSVLHGQVRLHHPAGRDQGSVLHNCHSKLPLGVYFITILGK